MKAAVLLMLGRFEELITCLEYYLPVINEQEEHTEMSALLLAVRLKHTGMSMQQMEQMIIAFYSAKVWDKLRLCWLCDDPLDKLLSSITDKDMENAACSALLVRLKERFSHTPISQQSLRSLLNP